MNIDDLIRRTCRKLSLRSFHEGVEGLAIHINGRVPSQLAVLVQEIFQEGGMEAERLKY